MKRAIFLFAFTIFVSVLSAQSLRATVRDANEPLAFANIYVNGIYLKSADQEGKADIPEGSLNPGDTISSSFLGFEPAFAIYDETIRSAHSCMLIHSKEQTYEMENVVVSAGIGGWEAFQQFVEPAPALFGSLIITGDIEAHIRLPDNTVRHVTGSFSQTSGASRTAWNTGIFPVELTTRSDTTGISRKLKTDMFYAYFTPPRLIYRVRPIHNNIGRERNDPYQTLTYLGLRDGMREFVFTYVSPEIRGTNQFFIYVNAESEQVESMHLTSTAKAVPFNTMVIEYKQYDGKNRRKSGEAVASRIEADFRLDKEGFKQTL